MSGRVPGVCSECRRPRIAPCFNCRAAKTRGLPARQSPDRRHVARAPLAARSTMTRNSAQPPPLRCVNCNGPRLTFCIHRPAGGWNLLIQTWWRRRELNQTDALKTNKLLIQKTARRARTATMPISLYKRCTKRHLKKLVDSRH